MINFQCTYRDKIRLVDKECTLGTKLGAQWGRPQKRAIRRVVWEDDKEDFPGVVNSDVAVAQGRQLQLSHWWLLPG